MAIKKYNYKIKASRKGFSLVELVVALGVFVIVASGVIYVVINSYRTYYGVGDKQVVVQFAQEGMEAVRSIRDNGWQTIVENADGDPRGVQKTNGVWQFSGVNNILGGLTRVIVVSAVERDSTGAIVASGGSDNPDTKKITVTVSGLGIADYVLTTYYTNWSTKTWEQTDWSGTTANQFWASLNTVSAVYSNISTSTVGQVLLVEVAGTYSTPGSLVSSIFDLGSTDKVLTSLNVSQNVPSGCSLTVTLEGSNDSAFATFTDEAFIDSSVTNFTSTTPATLNNFRYMRYRLALVACDTNTQTPTLYSLRLNFH